MKMNDEQKCKKEARTKSKSGIVGEMQQTHILLEYMIGDRQ